MARRKTQETDASVDDFIESLPDQVKRQDCRALVELVKSATGQEPRMWGTHIVGFGKHYYEYADGRPAEICKVGFAPRSRSFAFYMANFPERATLLDKLGEHRFSGGCLHIAKLNVVDPDVLETIVRKAYLGDRTRDA